jgi:hypothetical protein
MKHGIQLYAETGSDTAAFLMQVLQNESPKTFLMLLKRIW